MFQFLSSLLLPFFSQAMGAVHQVFVFPILFSFLPFVVLWDEFCFYKPVQFGEQNIGEDWTEY